MKTATLLKSPPPSKDNYRSSRPLLAIVKKGRYDIKRRGREGEREGGKRQNNIIKELKRMMQSVYRILCILTSTCWTLIVT